MAHDALELALHLVSALPGRFGVGGDRWLHAGRGLYLQTLFQLLSPGCAFQFDEFVCQFDCRGRMVRPPTDNQLEPRGSGQPSASIAFTMRARASAPYTAMLRS
ncbi:hypothetical protein OG782_36965 [Streptomyces sp. NBC_00876]|uniref:hypothetical protein n=1 Tax=Streptomyces sp. NBC_00876 TaxID=2975853 RepID=UPI00386501D4|nr:hypothetical protein OG782_36965 [Streptomyces sp. NBC_00876]